MGDLAAACTTTGACGCRPSLVSRGCDAARNFSTNIETSADGTNIALSSDARHSSSSSLERSQRLVLLAADVRTRFAKTFHSRTISMILRSVAIGFATGFSLLTLWLHAKEAPPISVVHVQAVPPCSRRESPTFIAGTAVDRPPGPPPAASSLPAALPESNPSETAVVAMCVGGLLSLDIPARGRSVRLGVLESLRPDVFIAGTLNATRDEATRRGVAWEQRVRGALERIEELAPFAAISVERQPSAADLAHALRRSGFFEAYARQASKQGEGRLRQEDDDPRLWLPTMLSPALGNPSANTLREVRCYWARAHQRRLHFLHTLPASAPSSNRLALSATASPTCDGNASPCERYRARSRSYHTPPMPAVPLPIPLHGHD